MKHFIGLLLLLFMPLMPIWAQVIDTVCTGTKGREYKVIPTPGSTYYWTVEDGGQIAQPSNGPSVFVDWGQTAGIFTISVIETSSTGCLGDTVKRQVFVKPAAQVKIFGPDEICKGETVTLEVQGAEFYIWSTGDVSDIKTDIPQDNTIYSVIGYNSGCPSDTATFSVTVHQTPKADFTFSPDAPEAQKPVQFNATDPAGKWWEWYFDSNTPEAFIKNPTHIFETGGSFDVTLVVGNEFSCSDSSVKRIFVNDDLIFFIPNAFSPNVDDINETFNVKGFNIAEIELNIFNKWGQLIFVSTSLDNGWDGTFKGQEVQAGAYIYTLMVRGKNNKVVYDKGSITLIR